MPQPPPLGGQEEAVDDELDAAKVAGRRLVSELPQAGQSGVVAEFHERTKRSNSWPQTAQRKTYTGIENELLTLLYPPRVDNAG